MKMFHLGKSGENGTLYSGYNYIHGHLKDELGGCLKSTRSRPAQVA